MSWFNRNGVWFRVKDGGPADVEKYLHQAQLDLNALKARTPGLEIKHYNRPGMWKISSVFGRDEIHMAPELVAGVKKRRKRVVVRTMITFIPGICLIDPEQHTLSDYASIEIDAGDVSICATGSWQGIQALTIDNQFNIAIGHKLNDFMFDDTQIYSCTNWADVDYRTWWLTTDYELVEDNDTDSGWDPLPYMGYDYSDAAEDYCRHLMTEYGGTLYSWPLGTPSYCGQTQLITDLGNSAWPVVADPPYVGYFAGTSMYGFDDGYETEDENGCVTEKRIDGRAFMSGRCGDGHLMAEVNGMRLRDTYTYSCEFTTVCICEETDCSFVTDEFFMYHIVGNPQNRTITETVIESYPMMDDTYGVRFDHGYGWDYQFSTNLKMTSPCETSQTLEYFNGGIEPYPQGDYCGGYVKSDCEIEGLREKFFAVYMEEYTSVHKQRSITPWDAGGYGYNSLGVWDDGYYGWGSPDDEILSETSNYYALAVHIDGERVELDRTEDTTEEFTVTDSHIFEFGGLAIYMYAYCRHTVYPYHVVYTRYGYFMGSADKHFQSDLFYPSGLSDGWGRTTLLHNVFGSAERSTPKYGYGKCWGYFVYEEIEEVIDEP